MSTEVKVNLDALDTAAEAYRDAVAQLEDAVRRADAAAETLRSGQWKTDGADAFFAQYDGEWKTKFQDHIGYLSHLSECLQLAKTAYHQEYDKPF